MPNSLPKGKQELLHSEKHVGSGEQLLDHLNDYFAWLDANPLNVAGKFNAATGVGEYSKVPRSPSATGFGLYLGGTSSRLLALRDQCPEAFAECIERLRQRLLIKAVAKDFARLVAARPLLDLQVSS